MIENRRYLRFFLLLAPGLLAELLSGNTPIMKLANPVDFIMLVLAYGIPVLLIWEYKIKYNLSSFSLFFVGIAYGIFNEGLIAKTILDTSTVPFGGFIDMSDAYGINWSWAMMILPWHAFFSVLFPITLAEALFHNISTESLLSRKWIIFSLVSTFIVLPLLAISWQGKITLILYICFYLSIFLFLLIARLDFFRRNFPVFHSSGILWGILLLGLYLFQFIGSGKMNIGLYILGSIGAIIFFLVKFLSFPLSEQSRFAFGGYLGFGGFSLLAALGTGRIDMIFSYIVLNGTLSFLLSKYCLRR